MCGDPETAITHQNHEKTGENVPSRVQQIVMEVISRTNRNDCLILQHSIGSILLHASRWKATDMWMRCVMQLVLLLCLGWAFASVVSNFPHQLCYFNEAAGGPENGYQHLLGSSFDWGQADGAAILRAETIFPNFDVTTVPPLKRNEFSKARERISDTANSKSTGRVVVFSCSVYAAMESQGDCAMLGNLRESGNGVSGE